MLAINKNLRVLALDLAFSDQGIGVFPVLLARVLLHIPGAQFSDILGSSIVKLEALILDMKRMETQTWHESHALRTWR